MKCPNCGNENARVKGYSETLKGVKKRNFECTKCNYFFVDPSKLERRGKVLWTEKMIKFVMDNYEKNSYTVLAKMLVEEFGVQNIQNGHIQVLMTKLGLKKNAEQKSSSKRIRWGESTGKTEIAAERKAARQAMRNRAEQQRRTKTGYLRTRDFKDIKKNLAVKKKKEQVVTIITINNKKDGIRERIVLSQKSGIQ